MDARFWDGERGGYFNSPAGAVDLVLRLKEDYDGAEPAASSVAAMNLLRLGAVFDGPAGAGGRGVPALCERAVRCLGAFWERWSGTPQALPQMLCALELALEPPRHVVIAGDPRTTAFRALAAVLHETIGPRRTLLAADGGEGQAWLAGRAPWLAEMKPVGGRDPATGGSRATAYVCKEFACQAPVSTAAELRAILSPRG